MSAQAALHWMGHNWADNFNRTLGMLVAKYQLADFASKQGIPSAFNTFKDACQLSGGHAESQ
jgi:hypothetical protein